MSYGWVRRDKRDISTIARTKAENLAAGDAKVTHTPIPAAAGPALLST